MLAAGKPSRWIALGASVLVAGTAWAGGSDPTSPPAAERSSDTPASVTTLEQLKQRSPIQRWNSASKPLQNYKPATPAVIQASEFTVAKPSPEKTEPSAKAPAEQIAQDAPKRLEIDPIRHQPRRAEQIEPVVTRLDRTERPRAMSVTHRTSTPATPSEQELDRLINSDQPLMVFQPAAIPEMEIEFTSNERGEYDSGYADDQFDSEENSSSIPFDFRYSQAAPIAQNEEQNTQPQPVADDESSILDLRQITDPQLSDPRQLKRISEINPFYDYEPTGFNDEEPDCYSLCPCPDGNCRKPGGNPDKNCLCPEESWPDLPYSERYFAATGYHWEASNLWYNPLYFQDVGLERYGHTHCEAIQPFISLGKFGGQVLTLPYQMSLNPVCRKKYALGYYRPGECAPKKCYQPPLNAKAAAAQAGVMTGMILLFP